MFLKTSKIVNEDEVKKYLNNVNKDKIFKFPNQLIILEKDNGHITLVFILRAQV